MRRIRIVVLLVCLGLLSLTAASSAAIRWVKIDGSMAAQTPQLVVETNTAGEFAFRVHLPGLQIRDVEAGGQEWNDAYLPQASRLSIPGEPAVPVLSQWIAVPQGAEPAVQLTAANARVIPDVMLAPAQEAQPDCYCADEPVFTINEATYEADAAFPGRGYDLEGPFVVRGLRMYLLRVYPVQFNPARAEATVYADLHVRIDFAGSKGHFFSDRRGRAFDSLYGLALNRQAFAREPRPLTTGKSANGAEFVIVAPANLVDAAQDLADWKILQGYDTEVYTIEEIGNTENAIKAWVQDAYDTWDPAPEFVLFFGDADKITPTYDNPYIASDLYYFTVDGGDVWPDIAHARISVDTPEEAQQRVANIINYERYPIDDSTYYTNSYHAAYFQHQGGGYEERRFLRTSEETYQWFLEFMPNSPFTPHRIYVTESMVNPRYWNQDTYFWTAAWWTLSDVNIPAELLRENGFPWDGNAADITDAVNGGTAFLTHRDHGDVTMWSDPAFNVNQTLALTNGDKLPVVWSINCLTGYFDYELKAGDEALCFSEAWERNPNGGAVGILASTRVSYSGINDRMFWGWLDAMFPDYVPDYPAGTNNEPEWRMSLVLTYGKMYMDQMYPSDPYKLDGIEEFHWFGDPTMEMWAGEPADFVVDHLPVLPLGSTGFDVSVNADDALVALVQAGVILGKAYSAGGAAHIEFDTPVGGLDDVHLTITRRQYRPYETDLMVGATADGLVNLNKAIYADDDTVHAVLSDSDLTGEGTYVLTITSTTEPGGEDVTLTEIPGTGTFTGEIALTTGAPANDGLLSVADADDIVITYFDEDTGGGSGATKTDTALADCGPPAFGGLTDIDAGDSLVELAWAAATDLSGPITYRIYRAETSGGQNFDVPVGETQELEFTDRGLQNFITYYYVVRAVDPFGHEDANTTELSDMTVGPIVIWEEDFDDKAGIPSTWEVVPGGSTACAWADDNPGARSSEWWDATFIIADALACGSFQAWDDAIITEPIDCSGHTDIALHFTHEYEGSSGLFPSHALIDVTNDGGDTWHNLTDWRDSDEGLATVDLSQWADNQEDVRIRFTYSVGNFGGYWGLDNLEIVGVPNTDPPGADFSATPTQGRLPLTVDFLPVTTGAVTAYEWDFGDGSTSTEAYPTHVYETRGEFDVTLHVTGPYGEDELTKAGYITANCVAPTLDFAADVTSGEVPLNVQFTDLTQNYNGCEPTAVEWDFGDGTTSAEANPAHVYTEPGSYTVKLTYTIDFGSGQVSQAKVAFIHALCALPDADFSADATTGDAPLTVQFTDLSTAYETCPITSWLWEYGVNLDNPASRTEQNPTITFSTPGVYHVRLTATNEAGDDQEVRMEMITVTEPGVDDDDDNDDDQTDDDEADDDGGDDDDASGGCGC
jgi:PKD repeat protein